MRRRRGSMYITTHPRLGNARVVHGGAGDHRPWIPKEFSFAAFPRVPPIPSVQEAIIRVRQDSVRTWEHEAAATF